MNNIQKIVAEAIGTFTLVFLGCGAAMMTVVGATGGQAGVDPIGLTGIALAFGLALIGAAYGIGPISGCHINPAVSLGAMISGRMSVAEMIQYWIGQFAGAIAAAAVLAMIAANSSAWGGSLGQNGWGAGYLGEYGMMGALVFEIVATFLFVVVILGSTSNGTPAAMAGLAIGLMLVAIHLAGIQVTGVSVNPARSFGPALMGAPFEGGGARLAQVWLFFVGPAIGAVLAGLVFRGGFMGARHPADES